MYVGGEHVREQYLADGVGAGFVEALDRVFNVVLRRHG